MKIRNFKSYIFVLLFLFLSTINSDLFSGIKIAKNAISNKLNARVAEIKLRSVIYNKAVFIYDSKYNMSFFGFEKLHSFDSKKYEKVYNSLIEFGVSTDRFYKPRMVTDQELLTVHTEEYLDSLKSTKKVLQIAELWPNKIALKAICKCIPNGSLQKRIIDPMRRATAGTATAARIAFDKKKNCVNIGGGFHHAKRNSGGGFCYFADIPYAVNCLWKTHKNLKVMIVDLDAHQGNGYEDIFCSDNRVSIFDVYCVNNYPMDQFVKKYITYDFPIFSGIKDKEYLELLGNNLPVAMDNSKPELIIYNAGTDPYENDPIGKMSLTKEGLVMRDELVFEFAKNRGIPVCMVTSGGYSKDSAEIIASSLKNLIAKKYLEI